MIQRLFDARKQGLVTRKRWKVELSPALNGRNSGPAARKAPGRLLAIDLGAKRVGVAVCDELRMTVRPLPAIQRGSWKHLLRHVTGQIESFQVQGLVIGLPLNLD